MYTARTYTARPDASWAYLALFCHTWHAFLHWFIHLFIYSFIYSSINLFIHSFIHAYISFIHSLNPFILLITPTNHLHLFSPCRLLPFPPRIPSSFPRRATEHFRDNRRTIWLGWTTNCRCTVFPRTWTNDNGRRERQVGRLEVGEVARLCKLNFALRTRKRNKWRGVTIS